ncbi:hypothetical protein EVA_16413 [gut metagenome]|uniref:Uncharacterized protein n=1 Tax=gut metagenome TaxID=749906 RepID=J9FKR0_9ZZZZ
MTSQILCISITLNKRKYNVFCFRLLPYSVFTCSSSLFFSLHVAGIFLFPFHWTLFQFQRQDFSAFPQNAHSLSGCIQYHPQW